MKSLKSRIGFVGFFRESFRGAGTIALLVALAGCNLLDNRETKRGSEVENEVVGTLVDTNGRAAVGARVWVHQATGFPLPTGTHDLSSLAVDSALADSNGKYAMEGLPEGEYNLIAEWSQGGPVPLVAFIPGVEVKTSVASLDIGTDTLRVPGAIKGRVTWGGAGKEGGIAYIPGTTYLAFSDANGEFLMTGVPKGTYPVHYLITGFKAEPDSAVSVRSGKVTVLPDKELGYDPALLPPAPTRLQVRLDTLTSKVRLEWSSIKVSDLLGYLVYRDTGLFSAPELLTPNVVTDTFYFDNLSKLPLLGDSLPISYRVISVDRDKNASIQYSPAAKVNLVPKDIAESKITLKRMDREGDRASVGDTLRFEVSYLNRVHAITKVEWWIAGSTIPVRTRPDSTHNGKDTLSFAWNTAGKPYVAVVVTGENGPSFAYSMVLNVLQDAPLAQAGPDISALLGDTVVLYGRAIQEFGSILSHAWDIGGTGHFQSTPDGDFKIGLTDPAIDRILCILKVVDDDGNVSLDSSWVRVDTSPDLVELGSDLVATASDTIHLQGQVLSRPIKIWEWDIGGLGVWTTGNAENQVILPLQDSGRVRCIVKVTDYKGFEDLDTVVIRITHDIPRAILKATNHPVPSGSKLSLSAGASFDEYGHIVEWAWKIGDASGFSVSGPDTSFFTAESLSSLKCVLKVTDEDGHFSFDSLTIDFLPAGTWVRSNAISSIGSTAWMSTELGKGFGKVWYLGVSPDDEMTMFIFSSEDMLTWDKVIADTSWRTDRTPLSQLFEWNGKMWVVFHNSITFLNEFWSSPDGVQWELTAQPSEFTYRSQCVVKPFNGELWLFSGSDAFLQSPFKDSWRSADGKTWTKAGDNLPLPSVVNAKSLVFGDRMWMLGGASMASGRASREIWNTADGINWVQVGTLPEISINAPFLIEFHRGKLWLIESAEGIDGTLAKAWSSTDGKNWSDNPDPAGFGLLWNPKLVSFKDQLWLLGNTPTTPEIEIWLGP